MLIIISCSLDINTDHQQQIHPVSTKPELPKNQKAEWLQYLLIFFREFIEEGVVDYAKKNPSTVVYVSPQASRIPKIVAEYCKCSWLCVLLGSTTGAEIQIQRSQSDKTSSEESLSVFILTDGRTLSFWSKMFYKKHISAGLKHHNATFSKW